jgi:hypothetical protein
MRRPGSDKRLLLRLAAGGRLPLLAGLRWPPTGANEDNDVIRESPFGCGASRRACCAAAHTSTKRACSDHYHLREITISSNAHQHHSSLKGRNNEALLRCDMSHPAVDTRLRYPVAKILLHENLVTSYPSKRPNVPCKCQEITPIA